MPDPTPPPVLDGDFTAAHQELEEELARIDARDLLPINLDVSATVIVILGVAPKLASFRPAMAEWFGEEMAVHADRLEQIARAAWHAHSNYTSMTSGADIPRLSALALEIRAVLLADAQGLVARRLLSPDVLEGLTGPHGHANQCFDLLHLVSALQRDRTILDEHTRLTRADLARAESIANQLASAVGTRDQAGSSAPALHRQRAFTLLVRTYNQVRRMLAFLRFEEGDAELIAPSLWTGRGRRRRPAAVDPAANGAAPPPPGPPPTGDAVPRGLPGESPFVDP